MKRHIIQPQSHNEWLMQRSKGIGSSEIGTILGLNKFETPYQLWLRKTGQVPPKEENEAMLMGHLLEDAVAQRWAIATENDIIKSSAQEWIYVHPEYDYFRASPDRIYWGAEDKRNEENKKVLECKTTVLDVDADNIPQTWYCQLQWLMHCTGYKQGSLAWIQLAHRQFGYKDIDYDKEFAEFLAEKADKFWNENILGGVEPKIQTIADLMLKYPKDVDGKTIEAVGKIQVGAEEMEIKDALQLYKSIKESVKNMEETQNDIENALKAYMTDCSAIVHTNETGKLVPLVTWKAAKPSQKFDAKAFKADNPEMYEQYCSEVAGSRRFLVK